MAKKSKTQRRRPLPPRRSQERRPKPRAGRASRANAPLPRRRRRRAASFKKGSGSLSLPTMPRQSVDKKPRSCKPKKKRFQFLRDVKSEMKRVTWPTRRMCSAGASSWWCALLFFGILRGVAGQCDYHAAARVHFRDWGRKRCRRNGTCCTPTPATRTR